MFDKPWVWLVIIILFLLLWRVLYRLTLFELKKQPANSGLNFLLFDMFAH